MRHQETGTGEKEEKVREKEKAPGTGPSSTPPADTRTKGMCLLRWTYVHPVFTTERTLQRSKIKYITGRRNTNRAGPARGQSYESHTLAHTATQLALGASPTKGEDDAF